jgi:hypothetical protein
VKLVVVDYLQLVRCRQFRNDRYAAVTEVSGRLRDISFQTGVPIVALSQLSRPEKGRENAEPTLFDLKECGNIENDSFQVWLLFRPKERDQVTGRYVFSGEDWVLVAKNRNGEPGNVPVVCRARYMRIGSREHTIVQPTPTDNPANIVPPVDYMQQADGDGAMAIKKDRAVALHKKMSGFVMTTREGRYQFAKWAIEFENGEGYRQLGFPSMKAYWQAKHAKLPYATVAEVVSIVKVFHEEGKMSIKELCEYPKENLKILAKLPDSKRFLKTNLEYARDMDAKELRALVNKRYKTHLEDKNRLTSTVPEASSSSMTARSRSLRRKPSTEDGEEVNRAEALELVCVEYLQRNGGTLPKKIQRAIDLE